MIILHVQEQNYNFVRSCVIIINTSYYELIGYNIIKFIVIAQISIIIRVVTNEFTFSFHLKSSIMIVIVTYKCTDSMLWYITF